MKYSLEGLSQSQFSILVCAINIGLRFDVSRLAEISGYEETYLANELNKFSPFVKKIGKKEDYFYVFQESIFQDLKALIIANDIDITGHTTSLQEEIIKQQNIRLNAISKKLITSKKILTNYIESLKQKHTEISEYNEILREKELKISLQNEEITQKDEVLTQQNQQLEQFSHIVAHNFRAPIVRILGLGNLINLVPTREEKDFIVDKLIYCTIELDTVMKDVSQILETQKNEHKKTEIDIGNVLVKIQRRLETDISNAQASIIPMFLVSKAYFYEHYLENILHTLVSNAIKYRHPNRRLIIRISTQIKDNYLIFSIKDNGLGIDLDKFRNKIFGLYKRFHPQIEGKGLGLYLAKTQIESLGGKIEVESKEHEGTTFLVYLKNNFII